MLDNLSGSLGDFVNRKLQRMQIADQMRALQRGENKNTVNDLMDTGLGGHSLSQSLRLEDLLQDRSPNAITRSLGKTPVKFPSVTSPTQNIATPKPQLPQAAQVAQQLETPKKLSREEFEAQKHMNRKEIEEQKSKAKKQLQIDKETLPFYKKMKEVAAATPEVDARLDEMEELLNTGNVQWFGFLDSLAGVPYIGPFAGALEQAFLTTESQVFKKLSTDFLRDAKPYFGSNMSTREVELFLQRVPSLMLSNEGNRALIRNMRSLNEYSKEVDKILDGIIAENGGERPRHLESKLQARLKPATEKLGKSFRDSVKLIPQKDINKQKEEGYGTKRLLNDASKLALP